MDSKLLPLLNKHPVLMDGLRVPQWSTQAVVKPAELLRCELEPMQVQAEHRQFAEAAVLLHRTQTAWTNRLLLQQHGLAERVEALNAAAIALLRNGIREGAADQAGLGVVAGVLSQYDPTWGAASLSDKQRAYAEQAVILADGGVDCLILQGCNHVKETCWLVRFLKTISDAPLLCMFEVTAASESIVFKELDSDQEKQSQTDALARVVDAGADALGVMTAAYWPSLEDCLDLLQAQHLPLCVALHGVEQQPGQFTKQMVALAQYGIQLLGGGWGVLPEMMAALNTYLHLYRQSA